MTNPNPTQISLNEISADEVGLALPPPVLHRRPRIGRGSVPLPSDYERAIARWSEAQTQYEQGAYAKASASFEEIAAQLSRIQSEVYGAAIRQVQETAQHNADLASILVDSP